MDQTDKQRAGMIGGLRTYEIYGSEHMAEIGRRGAASTWKRYMLMPFGQSNWAFVDRETGEIKNTFYCPKDN
jgi:hypothetical protein